MELIIISPQKKEAFTIDWLEVQTPTGNYIIQPGHAPTMLQLSENKPIVFSLTSGAVQTMPIKKGIAEITRTKISLLVS